MLLKQWRTFEQAIAAWTQLLHKLVARNGCRNALETLVL
jgi:hypothetical protein